jgi:hypothetical protein
MTQRNSSTTQSLLPAPLIKRMLIGAAIALTIMTVFLLGVKEPRPEWGKLWMIRPLVVISFAGAAGGLFFHFMTQLRSRGSWKKIITIPLSVSVYIVGLWLGTVLGLNGTLWN